MLCAASSRISKATVRQGDPDMSMRIDPRMRRTLRSTRRFNTVVGSGQGHGGELGPPKGGRPRRDINIRFGVVGPWCGGHRLTVVLVWGVQDLAGAKVDFRGPPVLQHRNFRCECSTSQRKVLKLTQTPVLAPWSVPPPILAPLTFRFDRRSNGPVIAVLGDADVLRGLAGVGQLECVTPPFKL